MFDKAINFFKELAKKSPENQKLLIKIGRQLMNN